MNPKKLAFILCAIPVLGLASDTSVAGPVSGFIFDRQAQAIRPMLGVPGASYLGGVIAAGLDAASIAPDGLSALAVQDGRLVFINDLSGTPSSLPVEGALADVDLIAWGADGSAAVYSSRTGQAQLLEDVTRKRTAAAAVDVAGLPGRVSSLAVSGSTLLIGVEAEDSGGVYAVTAADGPRLLLRAGHPVAMRASGSDVYVADRARHQVWQIRNVERDATPLLFAEGLDSPVGVQLSADGRRLFVADAGARTLEIFDVSTRAAVARVDLEFSPTRLDTIGARSLLALNVGAAGREPLYVLDGSGDPAVYFVPLGREE